MTGTLPHAGANPGDPDATPRGADDLVPWGYRPGIITAITVFLGFTLAFLRFWSFEAPGHWRWYSVCTAAVIGLSIVLQLVALFRALRLEDVKAAVYRVTVRWFGAAVVVTVIGVLLASIEAAVR